MNQSILKVGGQTRPGSLKVAITERLKTGERVALDTVGVAANYAATKAVILAREELRQEGIVLHCTQEFQEIEITQPSDSPVKTGIRWQLNLVEREDVVS